MPLHERFRMVLAAAALIGLGWTGGAHAQAMDDPMAPAPEPAEKPKPSKTAPSKTTPSDNPLAGPSVGDSVGVRTIVNRDFDGKVRRLETTAEEAALAVLKLSPEEKAATQKIITERAAILDKAVWDNLELLTRAQTARATNNRREQMAVLREFGAKLEDLRARGSFRDEIMAALSPANAVEFKRLHTEYFDALVGESMDAAKGNGERATKMQIAAREGLQAIGDEVRRSYTRQLAERQAELSEFLNKLELEPAQETKVRNLIVDYATQPKNPNDRRRQNELFFKILRELNDDQKKQLVALLRERRG